MSQTAVRMAKAEESEGSDRTLQELRDSLRDAFERVGKNLRYLDYTLRPVLEIYPNPRESQITEQHFENYGPKRIALAEVKGETVSKKTIQRELNAFRHLLTVDRQGYSARQAAKKTGLVRGKLQGWRRNGFFNPPDGIYYDEEIDALKKIKSLVDQGAPIRGAAKDRAFAVPATPLRLQRRGFFAHGSYLARWRHLRANQGRRLHQLAVSAGPAYGPGRGHPSGSRRVFHQ